MTVRSILVFMMLFLISRHLSASASARWKRLSSAILRLIWRLDGLNFLHVFIKHLHSFEQDVSL